MKYLEYYLYRSGHSGLSNLIMSLEVGVVLSFLMDRLLVLGGNISPPANVVRYDSLPHPPRSKVTDLLSLPVPWVEIESINLESYQSYALTQQALMESVFYYPPDLDLRSPDLHFFAGNRKHFFTYSDEYKDAPVLRVCPGDSALSANTLTFYSYFFYLDSKAKKTVYQLLSQLGPQAPYAALAQTIGETLGAFNAVHMRRGDFKQTYGVTTLLRTPQEALQVLAQNFSRDDTLVILTDEQDDPFFDDIVAAYPKSVFIDAFILEHFEQAFLDLPCHDSISLAFVSQLVAAEAQDFVGSMTSTFTSLIQRYRGNRGKPEAFKFLWNELPQEGDRIERGKHPIRNTVPMRPDGTMVEERSGPYSWNRYNPRFNPAWMREWPESFLGSVLQEGQVPEDATSEKTMHKETKETDMMSTCPRRHPGVVERQQGELLVLEIQGKQGAALNYSGQAIWELCDGQRRVEDIIRELSQRYAQAENEMATDVARTLQQLQDLGILEAGQEQDGQNEQNESRPDPTAAVSLSSQIRNVTVQIFLSEGHQCTAQLPSNSPILHDLLGTLATRGRGGVPAASSFFQVPMKDGEAALSFASDQLVAVMTEPPVLIQAVQATPAVQPIQAPPHQAQQRNSQTEPHRQVHQAHQVYQVRLDHFLTPDENQQLLDFTLQQEAAMQAATVTTDETDYRKSRVLYDFPAFAELVVNRVRAVLPDVLRQFHMTEFPIAQIEAQLTAHQDGDYFKVHNDNGSPDTASREISYVYYFFRHPQSFSGGELRIYDTKIENGAYTKADSFVTITPSNNSIVFFPSYSHHEVLPVQCPSTDFADSRFTINGWIRRHMDTSPT